MIDCVQHSTSVLIHDLWNPSENNLKKSMSRVFVRPLALLAFFKIYSWTTYKNIKGIRIIELWIQNNHRIEFSNLSYPIAHLPASRLICANSGKILAAERPSRLNRWGESGEREKDDTVFLYLFQRNVKMFLWDVIIQTINLRAIFLKLYNLLLSSYSRKITWSLRARAIFLLSYPDCLLTVVEK